jgi:ATP-dependent Lon protease
MTDLQTSIIKKITKLQVIVQNVIRSNQSYKTLGFLEANDLNTCLTYAESIYEKLKKIRMAVEATHANDTHINTLQDIIHEISTLISLYGCDTLDNLTAICIGHHFSVEAKYQAKYNLLKTYAKPIRYRLLDWRTKLNLADESICKTADNFECLDFTNENFGVNFQYSIYGLKFAIHDIEKQHTLVIFCVIEDVMLDMIENIFLKEKIERLKANHVFPDKTYERFISCLTLKEVLVYPHSKLEQKYQSYADQYSSINKKALSQIINEFVEKELLEKRHMLIVLLIHSAENECHYLAYLLYDLLSNDINGMIDTYEQTTIYDSLPINVKKYFCDVMKQIVTYTNKLSQVNASKISLEQRICLMKTSDIVKEKAMVKLKEVKMKAEDTGSKAMQYLEGLLKIPFEIYKEEPVLTLMGESLKRFAATVALTQSENALKEILIPFPVKTAYTCLEVQKYLPLLQSTYLADVQKKLLAKVRTLVASATKAKMLDLFAKLKHSMAVAHKLTGKNVTQLRAEFLAKIEAEPSPLLYTFLETLIAQTTPILADFHTNVADIGANLVKVAAYMASVSETLDKSVYGHTHAKRQIERIIGQWLNGDITGYCFGFEGPPGVGKTSLAKKGIAQCLLDEKDNARPFAFIAMGGSTNSSTLDGHNYTYVGSTWGRIVDILMDTKIMNPIIFIDELDKVSKTENGKEIIGILTHLIDQTQNDSFQDKYFNGIPLNLSKALFIFSYNDVELIDKILLDRIHRIKFDPISVEDKLIITRNFILPEIYAKMGLENMIEISDGVIEHIINDYTAEPGVRKLKELIFEIIGEINLDILKNNTLLPEIPIVLTVATIKGKYLKDRTEVRPMKIHSAPLVGVINGLWANSVGKGGILPIEAACYPSTTFLELKLTGMQGDVMKESMTVAKSLAWSLFSKDGMPESLMKDKNQGLHIHVPEGATPKDGPSAGTAITIVLYSLFSAKKIKNDVAITGEICLQGRVTAIGGLELKILGGIRAGVKTFIYPQENIKDFNTFMEKYGEKAFVQNIEFIPVERIEDVLPLVFE